MRNRLVPILALTTLISLPSTTIAQPTGKFFVEEKTCQVTTKSENTLKLGDRLPLKIDDEDYQFYTGMYFDGGRVACLARRDLTQPQVLNLPITQHFVTSIKPDPTVPNALMTIVHEGNGLEVPVTHWGIVFKSTTPESINLNLLRESGRFDTKPVIHRFKGKAGKSVSFHLDSRAKAGFSILSSKGEKIATGVANGSSGAIVKATLVLPKDDTYQVIISPNKTKKGSYALSVNLNQIR
jgi:extradiol dioxygenase family protein